jgi:hypothetical protein
MTERPAPGTTATLNNACPWPERRGLRCTVVPTDGAEDIYPVHRLGQGEVIVFVDDDPFNLPTPPVLANGYPWSCCMPIYALDVDQQATS